MTILEVLIALLGIINLVTLIIGIGVAFEPYKPYTKQKFSESWESAKEPLLFPVGVYNEVRAEYNVVGSLIITILSALAWPGFIAGALTYLFGASIYFLFNFLFKKKNKKV